MRKTKRKITLFMLISILTISLAGCGGVSPVDTVKKLYEAAMKKDLKSYQELVKNERYSDEKAMEELSTLVVDAGGVSKFTFEEKKKKDLKSDMVNSLDDKYKKDWAIVIEKNSEGKTELGWLLRKMDGKYYIIDIVDGSELK